MAASHLLERRAPGTLAKLDEAKPHRVVDSPDVQQLKTVISPPPSAPHHLPTHFISSKMRMFKYLNYVDQNTFGCQL